MTTLPGAGDISEGQDVTLLCSVQRGSLPVSYTWYHTETKGALAFQTSNNLEGSHTIDDVRAEQQGGYYCVSSNPANETKQSLTVTIVGVFELEIVEMLAEIMVKGVIHVCLSL